MKYSEQDMAQLISEIENEFTEYVTKSEQNEVEEVSLEKSSNDFDYDESDIEEMNEMYASMSKSEKEAHYASIKSILFGTNEELNKSENIVKKDEETELLKSELANSKKETEDLKKNVETLTNIVAKIVKKAPARKAITQLGDIQVLAKSEESEVSAKPEADYSKLNKAEINKILSGKIRNGEIKKSEDREKINQFCYGKVKIDEIKHLL